MRNRLQDETLIDAKEETRKRVARVIDVDERADEHDDVDLQLRATTNAVESHGDSNSQTRTTCRARAATSLSGANVDDCVRASDCETRQNKRQRARERQRCT